MVTGLLCKIYVHKACSEDGQELDAPVKPSVEAPHQSKCERPQQQFDEETYRLHDDPSQVLNEISMLALSLTRWCCLTGASTSSHGAGRFPRKAIERHEPTVQATLKATRTIEATVCFLL
jgi:hypothetical protein